MKLGLQIVFAAMSLVPLYFGVINTWYGAARFMPAEYVTPAIDSQFRFQSAYYFGLALIIWMIIPRIEKHTTLIRILVAVMFVGGVARAYSYFTLGAPTSGMMAGMALELLLPLILIWHGRLPR